MFVRRSIGPVRWGLFARIARLAHLETRNIACSPQPESTGGPFVDALYSALGMLACPGASGARVAGNSARLLAWVDPCRGHATGFRLRIDKTACGRARFRHALGSVLASALLFLKLPHAVLLSAAAVNSFLFALFLKRRYDVAVVFLTLMVVLLTEIGGPVDWRLTIERLACTLAGGGLALLAAHFFWPSWEKDRFQPLMSEALLASCGYIKLLCRRFRAGTGLGPGANSGKAATGKTANSEVFASLRRMYGEPKNRADILQYAAAVANGNLRLTRVLFLLLLHLTNRPAPVSDPELSGWENAACHSLRRPRR